MTSSKNLYKLEDYDLEVLIEIKRSLNDAFSGNVFNIEKRDKAIKRIC